MNRTRTIEDLSLSELAGECIMPRLDIDAFAAGADYSTDVLRMVASHGVGGFCIFGGNPNAVSSTLDTLQLVAMQAHGVPMIFSADCEFGLPMRLKSGGTEFPDAMAIAKSGNPQNAFDIGKAIGLEMKALGLHWNFAPVADVNSNPANPIINTRAFGEDPETVITYATQFMRGSQAAGIAATAKHFPGHGDTSVDSHKELPIVENDREGFDRQELPSFKSLIANGIDAIMPGHLAAPRLAAALGAGGDELNDPATLSRTLITRLLREQLGFDGVVVTDAMEMHAITNLYGQAEASVKAIAAGVDILLLTPDPELARTAIERAVEDGRISIEELKQRVARILSLKERYVRPHSVSSVEELDAVSQSHRALASRVAKEAISVIGMLPTGTLDLLILCDDREQAIVKAKKFADLVRVRFGNVIIMLSSDPQDIPIGPNTLLVTFHRARGYIGGTAPDATVPAKLEYVAKRLGSTPVGLIEIGSPYLDRLFRSPIPYLVKTYSESWASIEAVVSILLDK